jgi:hypothetical protein
MQVFRYLDPTLFLSRAESLLMRAESENNLMWGICGSSGSPRRVFGEHCYLRGRVGPTTSNRIYQATGYRPVCDMSDFHFEVGS